MDESTGKRPVLKQGGLSLPRPTIESGCRRAAFIVNLWLKSANFGVILIPYASPTGSKSLICIWIVTSRGSRDPYGELAHLT